MQDDKINNNDDFDDLDFDELDDDATLDSLEEDALLDDASLDEDGFDDDWNDTAVSKKSAARPLGAKKNGSKMILPLAAGIIVLGGGAYYYTQIANNPTTPASVMPIMQESDITDSNLPMPSPMTPPIEDNNEFVPDYAASVDGAQEINVSATAGNIPADTGTIIDQGGALTPMPALQEAPTNDIVADAPVDDVSLTNDQALGAPPSDIEFTGGLSSNAADENNSIDLGIASPAPEQTSGMDSNEIIVAENEMEPEAAPVTPSLAEIESQDSYAEPESIALETPSDETSSAVAPEMVAEYVEQIDTLENELSTKQSEIDALNAQIAALNNQLSEKDRALRDAEAAQNQTSNTDTAVATPTPAAAPRNILEEPAAEPSNPPVAKPSPVATPKVAEPEIMPKWELRSAQPGRAFIGIVGAKDTQVVEVGSTLQGIGQIKSISQQNGIWVVQGTTGSITQ